MESKNNWKAWLYLAPALILMLVFTFYPLFNTFIIAFLKNYNYATQESLIAAIFKEDGGLTLKNFGEVLGLSGREILETVYYDKRFVQYCLRNTLIITFVTVPASVIISLVISVALNSIKPLQKIFQTIFFLPYVTNSIAVGMVFAVIFSSPYKDGNGSILSNGLWNTIFHLGDTLWIDQGADDFHGLFALCLFIIWNALPYKILIFLSGLQGIDKQYYQAAKIDSASKFKTFIRITVPLLSPQILYISITSLIGSFKEYTSVTALFNGQGTSKGDYNMYTVVYYIYDNIAANPQRASAAAIILFAIIMVFTVLQNIVSKKRVHY